MMILQQNIKVERMLSPPGFAMANCSPRSPVFVKVEPREESSQDDPMENDCVPLDLSVNSGRLSPGVRDSGTESDDSGGRCSPEGGDCKAYKKSLMKRYCKSPLLNIFFRKQTRKLKFQKYVKFKHTMYLEKFYHKLHIYKLKTIE